MLQHQAMGLAVPLLDVGISRAEDDVDRVGKAREDLRQRIDDVLDPMSSAEESVLVLHAQDVDRIDVQDVRSTAG
jgi:hypothetical protein